MFSLISTLFIFLASFYSGLAEVVTISTGLGPVTGLKLHLTDNKSVYEFLGLRYAYPPLGDSRFRPSSVYNTTYDGTYNATQYPCGCMQYLIDPNIPCINEDCLFLNIFTPSIDINANLPVMIFIHGGGFIVGASSTTFFHGDKFIEFTDGKVILVTINYRLGPFGCLQSEELYNEDPLNYPSYGGMNFLLDQINAIKWVKYNIKYYGGNSDKITVFGESAGGVSICMLLVSPLAKNLFNNVIIESGDCSGPWSPLNLTYGLLFTNEALNKANLPNNITLLRKLSSNDILSIEGKNSSTMFFWPSVDGYLLPDLPKNIYFNANNINVFNAYNIIFGFNSQDGLAGWPYFGPHPDNNQQYLQYLHFYTNNQTIINEMYNYYYASEDYQNASVAWYQINSDTVK